MPIHQKMTITLACFPQINGNGLCLWLSPSNWAWQPFLGHVTIKCFVVPKPRHPRVSIPHSSLAAGSYPCKYPTGQQEMPRSAANSLSPAPHPFLRDLWQVTGNSFLIIFLKGNILLILDWNFSVCWQILAPFTLRKMKPAEQPAAELQLCSCKTHSADPTQLPWGVRDLYLGTQEMTSDKSRAVRCCYREGYQ